METGWSVYGTQDGDLAIGGSEEAAAECQLGAHALRCGAALHFDSFRRLRDEYR